MTTENPANRLNPYLVVADAKAAMEFYQNAFDAEVALTMAMPDGKMGHAELTIGTNTLMLADEFPEAGFQSPHSLNGTPVSFCLYVDDVDASFAKALDLGAKEVRPVMDQFYGDRAGTLSDPFGHVWTLATRKEELTEEELAERFKAFLASQAEGNG